MLTLNQAIKSTRQLVAKEVDEKLKIVTKNTDKGLWRNKKIISTTKWDALKRKKDFQYQLLDYIPDDYVEIPFVFPTKDEKLQMMRYEWRKDYNDFLEYKKSPAFGEYKCRSCILHPLSSRCNESLRKITLKGLDKNYEYPCHTINMFDCPYGQGKQDSDKLLLTFRDVWEIISDALQYVYYKNMSRYVSGVSEDKCLETFKIPMKSVRDIYNVITNRKSLDMVLEQYIKYVEKLDENNSDVLFESETLREMKKPIIDYFIGLKIKIDELLNFEGKNLEEEKEDEKKYHDVV